jgi:thiamine biosynthesis lipoprotein
VAGGEGNGGRRLLAGAVGAALLLGIGIGLHLRAPSAPEAIQDPPAGTTAPLTPATAAGEPATAAAAAPVDDPAQDAASAEGWIDQRAEIYHGIPTRIRFRMPPERAADAAATAEAAWAEFRGVGAAFNAFDPASEVGRFNADQGKEIRAVTGGFATLLDLSREAWTLTGGAFDPTVWPVKTLWRRAAERGVVPTDAEIESARLPVGMDRLTSVRRSALARRPTAGTGAGGPSLVHRAMAGVMLDFGGIVKGHAVDRVADLLRAAGATDWLVQCGGEIAAHGAGPAGRPWRIGVRHPLLPDGIWGSVSRDGDLAVSTSGNYEQPVRIGDRDFHHIVDPRTGRPVASPLLGVTVAVLDGTDRNARADAVATGLTVMGLEAGRALVESRPDLAALFIVQGPDGKPTGVATSRMQPMYREGR